jgi:hypothetical protein
MSNDDAKRALLCCFLTTLLGIAMLAWATTVEEQFQPFVYGAGLLALVVGAVSAVGVMLAMLLKG